MVVGLVLIVVKHVCIHLLGVLALRGGEAWLLVEVHAVVLLGELWGATLWLRATLHHLRLALVLRRLRRHDLLIHRLHIWEVGVGIEAHLEVATLIEHALQLLRRVLRHLSLEVFILIIWIVRIVELVHLRHAHLVLLLGHVVLHVLHHLEVHALLHLVGSHHRVLHVLHVLHIDQVLLHVHHILHVSEVLGHLRVLEEALVPLIWSLHLLRV